MGDKTRIEWADSTWNPVTGCRKISAGCDNCYAERIATRFAGTPAYPNGFAVTLHPGRLDQPLRWAKPRIVFVCSMADLFHNEVPYDYIAEVFRVMAAAPQHTFIVLTKRPARMRHILNSVAFEHGVAFHVKERHGVDITWPLPNVWLGVSVENERASIRIPHLTATDFDVKCISAEPLLGPLDLVFTDSDGEPGREYAIGWVIVGGESGPGARPIAKKWVTAARDACGAADVPFFFKQWGEWVPLEELPAGVSIAGKKRAVVDGEDVVRVGKVRAGRHLDGRTWDEWPW